MNKKLLMFLFGIVLVVGAVSAVDAALCRGFDGYYHDCGYTYGHNSYGKGYHGHQYGKHVITLGGVKKYNPINDYYIYSGPGYQRAYKDARLKYVPYKHKTKTKVVYVRDHEPEVRKVRYIRDERRYEPRYHSDDKKFTIKLIGAGYDSGHKQSVKTPCGVVTNNHYREHSHSCGGEVITLGGSNDNIWHDGNPYHHVSDHDHNVQSWKLKGEKSCVDGFVCVSGDFY